MSLWQLLIVFTLTIRSWLLWWLLLGLLSSVGVLVLLVLELPQSALVNEGASHLISKLDLLPIIRSFLL